MNDLRVRLGASVLAAGSLIGAYLFAGLPAMFLLAAALVLSLVISLLWASLNELGEDRPLEFDEALHLAAPTAAEEQKRAVLRALKDLEYELSVGKISREDFEAGSAHYREEAKRFIALADASLARGRDAAEKLVQEELARSGVLELPLPSPPEDAEPSPKEGAGASSENPETHADTAQESP